MKLVKNTTAKGAGLSGHGEAMVVSQSMVPVENGKGRAWRCKDVDLS